MKRQDIFDAITNIYNTCELNFVKEEAAIRPELAGLRLFEEPIMKFGSVSDELFEKYKEPGVIGPWFDGPLVWLPEGKTVISLFFPFSEEVKESNRRCTEIPSSEWLHGRIEGQAYLSEFMNRLKAWFEGNDVKACVPSNDKRFHQVIENGVYGSNWSERHVAYLCGLGTFGLSKGIITEKGMAGRFCSVITSLPVEPDQRPYTDPYEYCIRCGACVRRCPVNAISVEHGKAHGPCAEHVHHSLELYDPRYGCGLCQTGVPCERKKPQELR